MTYYEMIYIWWFDVHPQRFVNTCLHRLVRLLSRILQYIFWCHVIFFQSTDSNVRFCADTLLASQATCGIKHGSHPVKPHQPIHYFPFRTCRSWFDLAKKLRLIVPSQPGLSPGQSSPLRTVQRNIEDDLSCRPSHGLTDPLRLFQCCPSDEHEASLLELWYYYSMRIDFSVITWSNFCFLILLAWYFPYLSDDINIPRFRILDARFMQVMDSKRQWYTMR